MDLELGTLQYIFKDINKIQAILNNSDSQQTNNYQLLKSDNTKLQHFLDFISILIKERHELPANISKCLNILYELYCDENKNNKTIVATNLENGSKSIAFAFSGNTSVHKQFLEHENNSIKNEDVTNMADKTSVSKTINYKKNTGIEENDNTIRDIIKSIDFDENVMSTTETTNLGLSNVLDNIN